MEQPVQWYDNFQVNSAVTGDQRYSRVAALEGGGFVVTWSGPDSGGTPVSRAQVYNAYGNPDGPELTLSDEFTYGADVVPLPGGGFAVAAINWVSGLTDVYVTIFDGAGTEVVHDFIAVDPVDPSNPGEPVDIAITALSDGTFVIVTLVNENDGSPYQNVVVQRLNAVGDKLGTTQFVCQDLDNTLASVEVADIGNGRFAVVWSGGEAGDKNLGMQRFEYDGDKVGGIVPIVTDADDQLGSEVTFDGSGNFLITYKDHATQESYSALAITNDGVPVGTPFQISDSGNNGVGTNSHEIIGLRGGGYFAAWIEIVGNSWVVVGRLLDSDGAKIGGEILIRPPVLGIKLAETPALAELADGRIVVTWNDNYGSGTDQDGHAVFAQVLDPRAGVANGTEASEVVVGSYFVSGVADVMYGHGGHDTLNGLDGNDTLHGGEGNDSLNGDTDSDSMVGGEGDDIYHVDTMQDVVVEAIGEGNDKVYASSTWVLGTGQEVEAIELCDPAEDDDLTGNEFAQYLRGNSWANKLTGLGGNDTLDGGIDADTLDGGEGNDLYVIDWEDTVVETANGGIDTMQSEGGVDLTDTGLEEIENVILTGAGGNAAIGNAENNRLTGNDSDNLLDGNDGHDTLVGNGGADTMEGEGGNDTYYVDVFNDVVIEVSGEGTDTVRSSINYTLATALENLVLLGTAAEGTGNAANNKLTGNDEVNTLKGGAGNDLLDGARGVDRLEGGKGNDTYVLRDEADTIFDSSGADDKVTSTISRSLGSYAGIENLTLTGADSVNGRGNGTANDLVGNSGKNQLKGLAGDDLLRGAGGADQLWGGRGRDTFDFNNAPEIGKSSGNRDIIKDFKHLVDKIDLKSIDANALAGGNNAFKFVAAEGSKFGGVAGQLIWDQVDKAGTSNDVTLISGDINGDKIADFKLELTGLVTLTNGDFIL